MNAWFVSDYRLGGLLCDVMFNLECCEAVLVSVM